MIFRPFSIITKQVLPLLLAVTLLTVITQAEAFAQGTGNSTLIGTQANISKSIYKIPAFVAMLAYVIATFFAITGLLKLKDWLQDSERNTLNSVIFRLVVAALMGWFPYIWGVINTSLYGTQGGGKTQDSNLQVPSPQLTVFEKAS